MINGEWGSGKTHFWNHKLRQRIENIPNAKGKNYKTIYISLYGINSIEEISKKIFLETNPMMSKTLKKFVDNADGNVIPEYVKTGIDIALVIGAVVGGAMFGDNLSMISDTTIAAVRTQGCELKDKFKTNFLIVLPAAIITIILLIVRPKGLIKNLMNYTKALKTDVKN